MIVVADTSPINYLLLLELIEHTLPHLYRAVLIPEAVHMELLDPRAPLYVRNWAQELPDWITVHAMTDIDNPACGCWTAVSVSRSLSLSTQA